MIRTAMLALSALVEPLCILMLAAALRLARV